MTRHLRVLIVEDSEDDALLILRSLRRGGYHLTYERVDTAGAMEAALVQQRWDIVIADYSLPAFDGLSALGLMRDQGLDLPFVLVSGTVGEELAVSAMKAGAHDYVMKGNLARLLPAVERELHEAEIRLARKRAEEALRESEERFRRMADSIHDGLTIVEGGQVVYVNDRMCEISGYARQELLQMNGIEFAAPEEKERLAQIFWDGRQQGALPLELEFWIVRQDGTRRCIHNRYTTSRGADAFADRYVVTTDITERKRAERLLQVLNEAALAIEQALTLDAILAAAGQEFKKLGLNCAILATVEDGAALRPIYYSYDGAQAIQSVKELLDLEDGQLTLPVDSVRAFARVVHGRQTVLVDVPSEIRQQLPEPLSSLASQLLDIVRAGRSIYAPLIVEDTVLGLLSVQSDDLTQEDMPAITAFAHQMAAAWRKAHLMQDLEDSLEQLRQTQAQFLQAQKMEAVGRLAGGVAHDFNNALTIIHLSTQLLKRQMHADDPFREYVGQIEEASGRAANLTKQLLSFSRREIVEPHVVDLSRVVADLSEMLRRIIGEDVELGACLKDDLWPVWTDPTQWDQVIVNLAVNARDAMPFGGTLSIETANVHLDETYDLAPGEYVLLSVSDTGMGMDAEVKTHLFEPFFTTKEPGKGTGLGLATVYGIVKQNGGHISVDSQPGCGTTFRIYLPRTDRVESEAHSPTTSPPMATGSETILVVEDDPAVRRMARQILRSSGYHVLSAGSGPRALEIGEQHPGPIHLLLTDVVLPQMSGRQVAESLRAGRPKVRILYMSGYNDEAIAHHGVLDEGVFFLPKPFTMETLTQKVRLALDNPA